MPKLFLQSVARFLAKHPRWMVAGAIVYFISPFDLIPEALVGPIGYIDDFVVLLLPYLIREYVKRLDREPRDIYDTTAE